LQQQFKQQEQGASENIWLYCNRNVVGYIFNTANTLRIKMELISHRGNIAGADPRSENTTAYVNDALSEGYAAIVDVWLANHELYLCSGEPSLKSPTSRSKGYKTGPPQERIAESYLENDMIIARARTPETLARLHQNPNIHCFSGDMALTSRGYIITTSPVAGENIICVNPSVVPDCYGICSDNIKNHGRPDADATATIPSILKGLNDKKSQASLLETKQEEVSLFIESASEEVLRVLEGVSSSDSKNLQNNKGGGLLEAREAELDSLIEAASLELQNSMVDLFALRDSFAAMLSTIGKLLEE